MECTTVPPRCQCPFRLRGGYQTVRYLLGILLLAAALLNLQGLGADPGENTQEFDKNKVLQEWHSLADRIMPVRSERAADSYRAREGKPFQHYRKEVHRYACTSNGHMFSLDIEWHQEKRTEEHHSLQIGNRQYKAELKKTKTKGGWLLTDLKLKVEDEKDRRFRHQIACPWLLCDAVWLPEWIADASFVIKRIEPLGPGPGPALLRIHFA